MDEAGTATFSEVTPFPRLSAGGFVSFWLTASPTAAIATSMITPSQARIDRFAAQLLAILASWVRLLE